MVFSDIELPDELWRARDEDDLVIFAGAGVSCGAPSSLPLFSGLVERIAVSAATARDDNESLDRFLGRLRRNGNMVHELASSILLDPASRPNPLHDLLLRLFGKPEATRLVTTNFDRHFTSACQARWPNVAREYYAPALPRGASFHGIVYLHGAAFINPKECVLTDEDFGRAYLTEGWATEFLKDMFERYTVLFIGYSHSDLVLNYLARGLPPSTRRFALHHGSDDGHWTHLGITPVRYPAKGDDHSSLDRIFDAWVRELESGLADSYQRLTQLAAADPTMLGNDDDDFVRRSLSQEDATKRFLNAARDAAWAVWLEQKGLISQLLRTKGRVEKAQEEIARWLATHFLDDEPQTLLGLVERHHQNIHPCLWFHIHLRLQNLRQPVTEPSFRKWVGIVLFAAPAGSQNRLSDLVLAAAQRRDIESLLLLMDRLVTPRIRLDSSYFLSESELQPTTAVTLNLLHDNEDYWFRKAWEKILRPALPSLASKLELIIRRALWLSDQLLRRPEMSPSYDPLRYARPDIETRTRPYSDAFDFVIDVALEVVRSRMSAPNQNAVAYLSDLFATGVPVIQRLAIAGVRISSVLSADEKLRWLLSKRILHSFSFRTETIKLFESNLPSCSEAVKSETLEAVMRGPEPDQREDLSSEQVDAATFSLLRFLKQTDESWRELDAPLTELLERYPGFQTLTASALPTVSPGARWVDPGEGFDLEAVLAEPATKFWENWLAAPDHDLSRGPSQWSYGAVLPTLAKRSISWVLSLGRAALDRETALGFVWSSIAQAIQEASRTENDWREILSLLRAAAGFDAGYEFAIRILEQGINADRDPLPQTLFEEADTLADKLTPMLMQSTTEVELGEDWVFTAINHPAGWHWRYWVGRGLKWRNLQTGEHSLPQPVTRNLRMLLEENWAGASIVRILCGNQIFLLDQLDSNFTRNVGFPLFSWSRNEEIALQTWSGFLAGGRWSVALKDFILEDFMETVQRWQSLPEASQRELGRHLAVVAVLVLQNPLDNGILSRCIKPLSDDVLEGFATAVSQILSDMKQEGAQAVWSRWLLEYLKKRSLGQPKPWTPGEVQQIPFWVLHAGSLFPDAVTVFKGLLHRNGIHADWMLSDMHEHADVFDHANACAELILAVADAISTPLAEPGKLSSMVKRLKSTGMSQELARALDELMLRLGISD